MKAIHPRRKPVTNVSTARWVAYATAGAATAVAGVHSADADIHYSGPVNQVVHAANSQSSVAFHFALGGGASFSPFQFNVGSGSGIAAIGVFGPVSGALNGFQSGYAYVSKLGSGVNPATRGFVTPGSSAFFPGYGTLAFRGGYANSQWLSPGVGFVGIRFNSGSGVQYGWARLDMNGAPDNGYTLVDFAWADPGETIVTGQIPEPGSLALLAVGAAGLLAWRRQRSKAEKAA